MHRFLCLAFTLLLSACDAPDYPDDWPAPDNGFFSRKGGCPDLTGDYDSVGSELPWLLGSNPDFESTRQAWFEHRAKVSMSDDGDEVHFDISINEKGFEKFRAHMLEHNLAGEARRFLGTSFTLRKGDDYRCSGGWLHSLHFPQAEREHGWQRKKLQVGRDSDGGLIAGATINQDVSLGWGDSRGVPLGTMDETRWYRWPARSPWADSELEALQGFEWRRYWWVNHNTRMATRMINYYLEPVCVRLQAFPRNPDNQWFSKPPQPSQDESGKCPQGWRQLNFAGTYNTELVLPEQGGPLYRLEWYPLGKGASAVNTIELQDVRDLPAMPRRK